MLYNFENFDPVSKRIVEVDPPDRRQIDIVPKIHTSSRKVPFRLLEGRNLECRMCFLRRREGVFHAEMNLDVGIGKPDAPTTLQD